MSNVAVIGTQWGDEGKGKIVDWLSSRADVVVRFQGGHNAGHTLVVDGKTYKLHLLPSGVVRGGKTSIIGNGVVLDPWALLDEIARIQDQGVEITPNNLMIADNIPLILPVHTMVDQAKEAARGTDKIGTTGRGIGPAYEDKIGRRAIRLCDLRDKEDLARKIHKLLRHHNALLRGLGSAELDEQELLDKLLEIAPKILPYAALAWRELDQARKAGKRILFEGAQGAMLDIDHGTYPFVTSSNTHGGQAAAGSGIGPDGIGFILGITKAYTTRVGSGPFPTELHDDIGDGLGKRGHEFGTTTGRKRRCGWFDAVMVRQALTIGGVHGIALTKLDVLDGMDEIKICTGYQLGDEVIDYFPSSTLEQHQVKPVYETLPGWQQSTHGARNWADLPEQAIAYIKRLEQLIGTPVTLVSTSPEREDTILVQDPFADDNQTSQNLQQPEKTMRVNG